MNFDYMAHLGDTEYLQKQINENDEIIIPRGNTVIHAGDKLIMLVKGEELEAVKRKLKL